MATSFHHFNSLDGLKIFYRTSRVKDSKNILLILHGWSEHSGRYEDLITVANKMGFHTYAIDHRGHGQSQGSRGAIRHFSQYTNDLMKLTDQIEKDIPGAAIIVFGHSMGGLIATRLIQEQRDNKIFTGLITSGAFLEIPKDSSAAKIWLAKSLSKYFPEVSLPHKISGKDLTSDIKNIDSYDRDLYNHGMVNARWFTEITKAQDRAIEQANKINVPTMILHGHLDNVALPSGSEDLFNSLTVKDKMLKVYPGMKHEVLNEVECNLVYGDIKRWLVKHKTS